MGAQPGRVGPNAILQSREALEALGGVELAVRVFEAAGLLPLYEVPPVEMVPQDKAMALHRAIRAALPEDEALWAAREGGYRTGRYILAKRIPKFARGMLQILPAPLAGRLLLKAIQKHAWTFAGTGRVITAPGPPMEIVIEDNPLAQPGCPWHGAVFETLFGRLVAPHVRVSHPACCATGAPACRFLIDISGA